MGHLIGVTWLIMPKFRMMILRTYTTTFSRAMGEVIRILYRSKEKGVLLLNSKAGDFMSYSLPRLSVQNWEEDITKKSHQYQSNIVSNSYVDLKVMAKVKNNKNHLFKSQGKAKTRPVERVSGNIRRHQNSEGGESEVLKNAASFK